jgi:hypothetical protein
VLKFWSNLGFMSDWTISHAVHKTTTTVVKHAISYFIFSSLCIWRFFSWIICVLWKGMKMTCSSENWYYSLVNLHTWKCFQEDFRVCSDILYFLNYFG